MIESPSLEQSLPEETSSLVLHLQENVLLVEICGLVKKNCHGFRGVPTSTKKQRFPLGDFNRLRRERLQAELEKKLDTDIKINQIKADRIQKEDELQRLDVELNNVEEKIRRKKRKIDELESEFKLEDLSANKKIKRPTVCSVLSTTSSDKLNLSRHQFLRRRKKTLNALRPIHCSPLSKKAYLVSILNLLKRVQSCHENHLLMGANVAEDHPLMLQYTQHLQEEMKQIEGKVLETDNGHKIVFQFTLIPCDMKWAASMSGELNNCAHYFSPFANVNQNNKTVIGGSIGGSEATWKAWDYEERMKTAEKVEKFKAKLKDPGGKQRNKVTQFISQNKSRQEFIPPLGKYVSIIKAEPLHNTNNGWQLWFTSILTIAMAHNKTPPSVPLSDIPTTTALMKLMKSVKDTAHCTRLFKSFERWYNEKRAKGIPFSYRFTGLESKRFSWHFSSMVHEVLAFPTLTKGSVLQLHGLVFIGLKLRNAASIYSRVEINSSQVDDLKMLCQHYFNAHALLLTKVNPTIWTIGYAIPHHTNQLFEELHYGLGLNSMQGREAKHIQLAKYTENTCNVQKHQRWWIVFRHEFVCQIWLREMDPFSTTYEETRRESFIPKKVQENDKAVCYCGVPKEEADEGCKVCTSDLMKAIQETVVSGKISPNLHKFADIKPPKVPGQH